MCLKRFFSEALGGDLDSFIGVRKMGSPAHRAVNILCYSFFPRILSVVSFSRSAVETPLQDLSSLLITTMSSRWMGPICPQSIQRVPCFSQQRGGQGYLTYDEHATVWSGISPDIFLLKEPG